MAEPIEVRSALGFMSDDMPLFALEVGGLLHLLSGYYPEWDPKLVDSLLEKFKLDPSRRLLALRTERIRYGSR